MKNILLIEPEYKNKYPPLGLMKISYFHKYILHDYVRFTKGKLPEALSKTKWDHIYVTSLFTFEWKKTIESIEYAKTLVDSPNQITVGGIAATLLPKQIFQETGIHPVTGLLNEPGKLGLPGDECIDQMIPDYDILDDVDYIYPYHDAYFLSATKGCGMRCGFCAVQKLEPRYVSYLDIKEKIEEIDNKFGPKRDLLLMDNNVLHSSRFNEIIDDIVVAGFGKGSCFINPKTGKSVQRFVDFNQGLDGHLLTEEKAIRLGQIALKPARVAFDHIEDRLTYERALRLCARHGITELSNYLLYNSEDFGGKGKRYDADTPENLYERMRITLDLKDEINSTLPNDQQVSAFSFPMRYIPLSALERGYVGTRWNPKFLRAVQCMLIPTQGKGVGSRSFFEADFGKTPKDFVRFLCMPDSLIASRGKFAARGRGHKDENDQDAIERREKWNINQRRIVEWNRLFDALGENSETFIGIIGDNEYLPEKLLGIVDDLHKKLYLHYLTDSRIVSLLAMLNIESPTYHLVFEYITDEFPDMYNHLLTMVISSEYQQQYIFKNFIGFFGKKGMSDIISVLNKNNFNADKILEKWQKTSRKFGITNVDFDLIRIYRRYLDLNILSKEQQDDATRSIIQMNMTNLANILNKNFASFEFSFSKAVIDEVGQRILNLAVKSIAFNIQLKIIEYDR